MSTIKECIILAGGLGTRLRDTVPGLPKCLAPVAGRPFLSYLLEYLRQHAVEKFILSLGYKHELIEEFVNVQFSMLNVHYSIEEEPLGTGGAIKLACTKTGERDVLILNGDSFFKVNIGGMTDFHLRQNADCTIALKPMQQFDRYGAVELNQDYRIISFKEKQFQEQGFINGGVYNLNVPQFLLEDFPMKFSFENDYLQKLCDKRRIYGFIQDDYFIDIGIPEDFERAQEEFANLDHGSWTMDHGPSTIRNQPPSQMPDLKKIDKSWTLFLDRDGVINYEKDADYIRNWSEFRFYEGALEALRIFTLRFGRIFIVTNQKGVGKGWMTEQDLKDIHLNLLGMVEAHGGHIDKIYYSTDLDESSMTRKPNPGMGLQAKKDFPKIDFSRSLMIGNTEGDMQFGKALGTYTIFIPSTKPEPPLPHPLIDAIYENLLAVAKAL